MVQLCGDKNVEMNKIKGKKYVGGKEKLAETMQGTRELQR